MMKIALIVLALFIGAFIVLGIFAPRDFHLGREIVVNRPKDQVFGFLKQFQNHRTWNAWLLKDPNLKISFKGTDGTVGFISNWESENPQVGTGEQEVLNIVDGQQIDSEIRFKIPFEGDFQSYVTTDVVGENQTKVVMGMRDQMSFPQNVFSFIFNVCLGNEKKLIQDMDTTLANLKTALEKK